MLFLFLYLQPSRRWRYRRLLCSVSKVEAAHDDISNKLEMCLGKVLQRLLLRQNFRTAASLYYMLQAIRKLQQHVSHVTLLGPPIFMRYGIRGQSNSFPYFHASLRSLIVALGRSSCPIRVSRASNKRFPLLMNLCLRFLDNSLHFISPFLSSSSALSTSTSRAWHHKATTRPSASASHTSTSIMATSQKVSKR